MHKRHCECSTTYKREQPAPWLWRLWRLNVWIAWKLNWEWCKSSEYGKTLDFIVELQITTASLATQMFSSCCFHAVKWTLRNFCCGLEERTLKHAALTATLHLICSSGSCCLDASEQLGLLHILPFTLMARVVRVEKFRSNCLARRDGKNML